MAKRWYVVHAYSGYEKHVMRSLIERVKLAGMEEEFGEILVPTEEVVEMRNGQKRKSERKFFPGYVLVQMEMNEGTWHLVKDTPRVMGFIGGKIQAYIKLQVKAGQANPSPPVGPALGQHGVNIMEFCKAFNAKTQGQEPGLPTPVIITVYSDRSFTFETKSTPAAVLLKKAAGITSGSARPNSQKVGTVTRAQLEEIAKTKQADLTAADLDAAVRTIAGSARSMGLNVEGV